MFTRARKDLYARVSRAGSVLALFVFPAVAGCSSTPTGPIVPTEYKLQLKAVSDAINANNFDLAREEIKALKREGNRAQLQSSIEILEQRLAGRELGFKMEKKSTLKATPEIFPSGGVVRITLNLSNPEPSPILIPAKSSGIPLLKKGNEGGLMGRLIVDSVTYDAYGNFISDSDVRVFSTQEEIRIPTDQPWIQTSSIQITVPDGYVSRQVRVFCELKVSQVNIDGKDIAVDKMVIGPCWFRAFPAGYEKIAENPLAALEKALTMPEEKYDPHLFIATNLLPAEQKKLAIAKFAEYLDAQTATRRRAVTACLRHLTGNTEPGFDEAKWKIWWKAHQSEYLN